MQFFFLATGPCLFLFNFSDTINAYCGFAGSLEKTFKYLLQTLVQHSDLSAVRFLPLRGLQILRVSILFDIYVFFGG